MTSKLITTKLDINSAEVFVSGCSSVPHYLAVSKHTAFIPDDQTIPTPVETQQTFTANLYNNLLFGKLVTNDDVCLMLPRHDWESGTVYDMYNGGDSELLNKAFYVSVNVGLFVNVYKCLDNNNGTASIIEPSGQDVDPFVTPNDGYTWKYMFSVPSSSMDKFATQDFIPVLANTSVQSAAVGGSVEVITIADGGSGYDNYFIGTFRAQDIGVGGDGTVFALTETASSLNGFYQNCIIKVTSGGANNEYRSVTSYLIAGGQKKIKIDRAFDVAPSPTDTYEIYPKVDVVGDGHETLACDARAIINSAAANSVSAVEVLSAGAGFRTASAAINPDSSVGVNQAAALNAIVSPTDGHGADPTKELGAKYACISVSLSGTEANNIPGTNDYRQISLLRGPTFANVQIAIDNSTLIGVFAPGETVYSYRPIVLPGLVITQISNSTITGTGSSFSDALTTGDTVLISDGHEQTLANVSFVSSNTSVTLDRSVTYANTTSTLSIIKPIANGTLAFSNTSTLVLSSCSADLTSDVLGLIGQSSSATVKMDANSSPIVSVNGASANDFRYFTQLIKIEGTVVGTFQADEPVYQGSNTYSATVFDYSSNVLLVSNERGSFNANADLVGLNSGAILTPTNKYQGSLKVDTGEILYFENISPITRASTKSETFKIIFEF